MNERDNMWKKWKSYGEETLLHIERRQVNTVEYVHVYYWYYRYKTEDTADEKHIYMYMKNTEKKHINVQNVWNEIGMEEKNIMLG